MSAVAFQSGEPAPYAALPVQMREAKRWLVWTANKQPFYVDGTPRRGQLDSDEDQARLGSLDQALAALRTGKYAGPGFALGPDGNGGHWQGVDTDHAEHEPLAVSLPGYVERSPSGVGFHAIGYGRPFSALGSNGTGVEAYSGGRYFTVTGHRVGTGEIECIADAVESRVQPVHAPSAPMAGQAPSGPPMQALATEDQAFLDLRSALGWLSADAYSEWVSVGLALKGLGDDGLSLWLEWSSTSAKFDHPAALAKWASFEPTNTGFRAVFAEAQRRGWTNPSRHFAADIAVLPAVQAFAASFAGQPVTLTIEPAQTLTSWVAPEPISQGEWFSAKATPSVIVANHLYADVGVLIAPGGTGKTTAILYQAVHIALGLPLWGMPVLKPGPVLILTAEDSRPMLVARLRSICGELSLSEDQIQTVAQRVRISDVSGLGLRLTEVHRDVVRPADGFMTPLIDACHRLRPVLVVIDPAVSFGVGESRVNDAEAALVEAARRLVRSAGCCVLYVHHSGKANARERAIDAYAGRGGSAFADGARMVHVMQPLPPGDWLAETGSELEPGESGLILARPKNTYGPLQGPLFLKRRGFAFDAVVRAKDNKEGAREVHSQRLWQFLCDEFTAGRLHSKNSLEATDSGLRRTEIRAALARLEAESRVELRDRPGTVQRGARQYLHPVTAADGDPAPPEPAAPQQARLID